MKTTQENKKTWDSLTESEKQRETERILTNEIYTRQNEAILFCLNAGRYDNGAEHETPFMWDDFENLYTLEEGEDEETPQEIFEYWFISDWFAERLKEHGEPVIIDYGVWGRTTTGQSWILDGVCRAIAKEVYEQ